MSCEHSKLIQVDVAGTIFYICDECRDYFKEPPEEYEVILYVEY